LVVCFLAAGAAAALVGCTVGPEFHRPAPAAVGSYTGQELPPETAAAPGAGGAAQRFVPGADIPRQWWALFHSESLDRVIRQALADSPTLAAAEAKLRVAQESRRAQAGAQLPSVEGRAGAARQQLSGAASGAGAGSVPAFTLYDASVSVSYAVDLFGGRRRQLEALQAEVDYQRHQLHAARLALTGNIVTTAVREASLRAQLEATRELLAAEEQQLRLVTRRAELGGGSRADVLAQEAQLAQARATLPPLEKQLAQARHRLALLAGKFPAEAAQLPEFDLGGLSLPQELPVSLPSELAHQRPDILAAEELLHAASAGVGVATANQYPQLTLTGSLGLQSTGVEGLFESGAAVWGLGAGLVQPIFRGGELSAKRRAAIAAYDQAQAQYRDTVLQAFQDVADVLRALELDARTLASQADAEAAARASLDLARRTYELGAASYLTLLNAQRQLQEARITLVQAQAARYADTAALFGALGGGWWEGADHP
jgi:NodT family efflux transporter outer membrane factor (OMF) lipoprotein